MSNNRGGCVLPLPAELAAQVRRAIAEQGDGTPVRSVRKVSGGYESHAFKLTTGRGSYFVKWSPHGRFERERRGLTLIERTGTVRVPRVLAARDAADGAAGFLVQEWLDRPGGDPFVQRTGRQLGEALARLHLAAAPLAGYGLDLDEPPCPDWVTCYRECCLAPAIELAARRGQMPARRRAALERLMGRLDGLLGGVERRPSLLHGDFHRGNVLCARGGELVVIDPHPWVGDREAELAQTEWQFRLPPRFYEAYEATYPSAPGRAERRDLYLVWYALRWGDERRAAAVEALIRWYVGGNVA
jgi:fructosamine-3-kinase